MTARYYEVLGLHSLTVWLCRECGVLVVDDSAHDRYHDRGVHDSTARAR